jgi:hypothetical protein
MNPILRCKKILPKAAFLMLFALLLQALSADAQVSVSLSGTSPTCNGWTNGSVTATASGGVSPYTYAWSNGFSGATISSVGAGTYSVTVTDANGAMANGGFNLTQPAALTVSITLANVCAANGNATATVSGGVAPYSYAWDNGATGASVSGLSAGALHCVTVTDANGCQAISCIVVPNALTLDLVVQGLACFNFCDASVEAVISGGTGPFSFLWSNGFTGQVNENLGPGTYSVTVTDANGCTISGSANVGNPLQIVLDVDVTNPPCGVAGTGSASVTVVSGGVAPFLYLWSTGATTSSISGLTPGTYTVTVTDFLGCQGIANAVVVPQSDVNLNLLTTPSSGCGLANGTASVVITGGTPPYSILWNNGSSASDLLGLAPGTYSVVVTDANGCGASGQVTVGGTPGIDLNITGVNAGCANNGSANAMVTPGSGTPPFTYLWNTGATTPIINNLSAGTYSVTVTDAAGCTATKQVTVTGSSNLDVDATGTNVTCFGGNNGTATATVTGATNVDYMWSTGGNTKTVTGLAAGTYFVTVVDIASGCTASTNVFISQPTGINATANGTNASCNGNDGFVTASASGGTAPYTFKWSNGSTMQTVLGLNAGTYTVTVTDANNCTATAAATITGAGGPSVSVSVTPLTGNNSNDGKLTATVSGGAAPVSIKWSTGATTATISNLGPGTYSVTVTDANGCTDDDTVTLTNPACIGDYIWNDMDRDGCQDIDELGLENITVTLTGTDNAGNAVNRTTKTNNLGYYKFDGLAPGTYKISVQALPNFVFSPSNACGNNFFDSDLNASGMSANVTLAAGQCNIHVDGGMYDQCLNVTNPGTICCDQTLCGPGNDPAPINSVTPASGGVGQIQYMWMYSYDPGPFNNSTWFPIIDANGVPTATGPSYNPGPISQTTYFIRCTKTSSCTDWKESNIVTITVLDNAVAEINGPDLVCVNKTYTYTATSNGLGATYSWNFGSWSSPTTSNQQTVNVKWSQWGVVYVKLTVTANGCTSTDEMGVAISDDPLICGNALVINPTNLPNGVMLEWDIYHGDGNYVFAIQRSKDGTTYEDIGELPQMNSTGMHHYSFADYYPKKGNAFYRVEIRQNGEHRLFSNVERVARFNYSQKFFIYPNPVSDKIMIDCSDDVQTAVKLEVLSPSGKIMYSEKVDQGMMSHPLDLSSLGAGAYFLRITFNNGEREIQRLVKE